MALNLVRRLTLRFASATSRRRLNWPLVLAFLVPLCIYAVSARRDVWFWDTGEMDTVPWILGIAHPTGFPAYVVLGFAFSHLLPFGSPALRMSLFSAVAMGAAAWFVARCVEERGGDGWVAAGCACLFAFGSIAWTRGTRAEVHALAALTIAATIFYALRWYSHGNRRDLYAGAIVWGIGLATHPVAVLLLPALLLLFVARLHLTPSREAVIAIGLALAAAAIWFVYLPLRSAYVTTHALDPTRMLGLPAGGAFWDYDHPASWGGFVALVTGGDFNVASGFRAMASAHAYRVGLPAYAVQARNEMTPVGVIAALGGVAAGWLSDRAQTAALVLFGALCVSFGLAFATESDPNRYFLGSFLVAAILSGEAAAWLGKRLPRRARMLPAAILGAVALVLLLEGRWIFGQATDERARVVISDVQRTTPRDAILIATWEDAGPLAYAAYVERSLGQRIVDPAWLAQAAAQVPHWAVTRPVFVVGQPYGSVLGYRLARVCRRSSIFALVRE